MFESLLWVIIFFLTFKLSKWLFLGSVLLFLLRILFLKGLEKDIESDLVKSPELTIFFDFLLVKKEEQCASVLIRNGSEKRLSNCHCYLDITLADNERHTILLKDSFALLPLQEILVDVAYYDSNGIIKLPILQGGYFNELYWPKASETYLVRLRL